MVGTGLREPNNKRLLTCHMVSRKRGCVRLP